jgi:hypothetical protein
MMKLSDMETEQQARPVLSAPPHSKWSYYLWQNLWEGWFNFNETNAWNWTQLCLQLNQMETFLWISLYKVHFHYSMWQCMKLRFAFVGILTPGHYASFSHGNLRWSPGCDIWLELWKLLRHQNREQHDFIMDLMGVRTVQAITQKRYTDRDKQVQSLKENIEHI